MVGDRRRPVVYLEVWAKERDRSGRAEQKGLAGHLGGWGTSQGGRDAKNGPDGVEREVR